MAKDKGAAYRLLSNDEEVDSETISLENAVHEVLPTRPLKLPSPPILGWLLFGLASSIMLGLFLGRQTQATCKLGGRSPYCKLR
jgi:hypothetical protein